MQLLHYMSPALLQNMIIDREFPLGVEDSIVRHRYQFAIRHSGLRHIEHPSNSAISALVYFTMIFCMVSAVIFLTSLMMNGAWTLADTIQDHRLPEWSLLIVQRGRSRGRVASLLNSFTFSLTVNASLDKFGLIEPSTSTALIGMTLGGTWGFMLDMVFGSDEGFREYLWSPPKAMQCLWLPLHSAVCPVHRHDSF